MIGRKGHELLAYWGLSTATGERVRYQCSAFAHADCRRGPLRCEGTNCRPLCLAVPMEQRVQGVRGGGDMKW